MKILKIFKIITTVINWCNLFKSKGDSMELPEGDSPAVPETADKTNVIKLMEPKMNEFLLKFCSDGFKKAMREKVIPILRIVANETLNKFDDAVVVYLEELFKPEK